MLASLIIILLPIALLANLLSSKVNYAIQHSAQLVEAVRELVHDTEQRFDITLLSDENINKMGESIAQSLPKILGATFNTVTTIFFIYFILYFMLVNSRKMEDALYEYIPLKDENVKQLGNEVNRMVISNSLGIPLVALAQAVVGLIAYLILGR